MTQIHYPQKPPVQPPKPELIPGGSRDLPGLWMTHDPAVFYDTEREAYYIYSTGALCRRSKDLLHWENLGKVVNDPPAKSTACTVPTPHGESDNRVFSWPFRTLLKDLLYRRDAF